MAKNVLAELNGCGPDAAQQVQDFGQAWEDELDNQPSKSNNFSTTSNFKPAEDHN